MSSFDEESADGDSEVLSSASDSSFDVLDEVNNSDFDKYLNDIKDNIQRLNVSENSESEDELESEEKAFIEEYLEVTKDINSDAQLCCPGCFAILCLDCQQHEIQKNLFRAMLVFNCQLSEKKDYTDGSSCYSSVKCSKCNIIVGIMNDDEVYEFFNVFSSRV